MAARLALVAVLVSAAACAAAAQPATAEAAPAVDPPGVGIKVSFRPSVAIVVGIFTMIFSLTFLLLMYAKFCHPSSSSSSPLPATIVPNDYEAPQPQAAAGVPKPVIESLPFFRFATLRGARQGMECAVCLARFDDADLLRLLPRCRHAFHLDCVDRWLDSNASCPLCRTRVHADDATLGLKYAASARIVFGGGDDTAGSGRDLLDIFVERVPSSRFVGGAADSEERQQLDRHRHRIVVSDVVFKSRWSELNSADLLALDTEMLSVGVSSGRFVFPSPPPEANNFKQLFFPSPAPAEDDGIVATTVVTEEETSMEKKQLLLETTATTSSSGSGVLVDSSAAARKKKISSGARSVSEIVSLPRLRAAARERLAEEENRRWLPIARRTARWFAGREKQEEGAVHVEAAHV